MHKIISEDAHVSAWALLVSCIGYPNTSTSVSQLAHADFFIKCEQNLNPMKSIYLLLALLISTSLFAQNNYNKGFDDGYSKGYCYGDIGCVPPVPPVAPVPLIWGRVRTIIKMDTIGDLKQD